MGRSLAGLTLTTLCWTACVRTAEAAGLTPVPAARSSIAAQASMMGGAWAGKRAVAVGDHGVVLLSDDAGASWRQARSVPVSFLLTAVSFADPQHGWAVGHGGAILSTTDGGESWQLQRLATEDDRPLFGVHFFDRQHGVAVGLWSLVLVTSDGGQHWHEHSPPAMPGANKADLNLLSLFAGPRGTVFATAERGQVLRSDDMGQSWTYLSTGYKGSLWSGAVLPDGALLVGGQRGTLLRSDDHGQTWAQLPFSSKNSVTGVFADQRGVTVTGLDGLIASSRDGRSFVASARPDGVSLHAALRQPPGSSVPTILLSRRGVQRGDAIR